MVTCEMFCFISVSMTVNYFKPAFIHPCPKITKLTIVFRPICSAGRPSQFTFMGKKRQNTPNGFFFKPFIITTAKCWNVRDLLLKWFFFLLNSKIWHQFCDWHTNWHIFLQDSTAKCLLACVANQLFTDQTDYSKPWLISNKTLKIKANKL